MFSRLIERFKRYAKLAEAKGDHQQASRWREEARRLKKARDATKVRRGRPTKR